MHAWKQDALGSQVTALTDLPQLRRSRKLGHVKINGCMLATFDVLLMPLMPDRAEIDADTCIEALEVFHSTSTCPCVVTRPQMFNCVSSVPSKTMDFCDKYVHRHARSSESRPRWHR